MADFRIRSDCRIWFRHITSKSSLKLVFDPYYLCFLVGIAAGRRSNPTEGGIEASAFVDSFPRPYDQQQRLLIGLMLAAELKRAEIDLTDRVSVNRVVNELAGVGGATTSGVAIMNEYASGGFDELIMRYQGREPWGLDEFMPRYLQILDELLRESAIGQWQTPVAG